MTYPTELMPTALGIQAYTLPAIPDGVSEEVWNEVGARLLNAQLVVSPAMRIVDAFDALKDHVDKLDADGLAVLASCAHQMLISQFGSRVTEALAVRDAAIAAMG